MTQLTKYGQLILIILFLTITTNGLAQNVMTLTLEQSVAMAIKQNPDLQIAEKELTKAKASIWEAYADLTPAIEGSANFQHAWDIQTNTIPNFLKPMLAPLAPSVPELADMPDFVQIAFGMENTFVYGLTLTQPIFLGGAGIANVKIAHASKKAAEYNLESTRQNLIFDTINAFYGCLLTKEVIHVQEEAMREAVANYDLVKKKYDAGSASGYEKLRAEVSVANLKPELIAANNNYQSALTKFRTVLGLPKDAKVDVRGMLEYSPDEMENSNLNDIQQQAYQYRPELLSFYSQKRIVSKTVSIARSQFLPKIFFLTDYSFIAMRNDYKFTEDDFSKGFTSAVSLQIPIFHGMKNHKQYQKARLDFKIMEDSEKKILDVIAGEAEIVFNTFLEAKEKYQSAEESVDLAEETLRLANLTYEEGASTQLDVMSSQLALTRARLNHITAMFEYQMARYALRKVTGTLKSII